MSNWLLFALLSILVVVNAYFTYRKTTDVDDTGRKLLAASQLIYLVFIGIIFVLGKIVGSSGIASKLQGGSTPAFIGMIVGVAAVLALVLFGKTKLDLISGREAIIMPLNLPSISKTGAPLSPPEKSKFVLRYVVRNELSQ